MLRILKYRTLQPLLLKNIFVKELSYCNFYKLSKTHGVPCINILYKPVKIDTPLLIITKREYAKGKDKGKGGKQSKTNMTEDELEQVINVNKYKEELDLVINNLKEDYIEKLTLRTSVGSLENIMVEFEGEKFPMNQLAQVIRKTPTMVIINSVDFPQSTADIRKAIENSGMNLNPRQDGTTIYVPIPKVTKEHREDLANNAKTLCDKSKIVLRDLQNKYVKKIKSKDGQVSDDVIFNATLKVRDMAQEVGTKLDTLLKNKQNELLKTAGSK